jgi:hypothetical protein
MSAPRFSPMRRCNIHGGFCCGERIPFRRSHPAQRRLAIHFGEPISTRAHWGASRGTSRGQVGQGTSRGQVEDKSRTPTDHARTSRGHPPTTGKWLREIGKGKLGTPTNRNLVGGRSNALQLGTHRRQMKVKRRMEAPSPCVVDVETKMGIVERRAAASAFARVVERVSSRSVRFVGCGSTSWPAGLSPSDRVAAQLLHVTFRFRSAYDRGKSRTPTDHELPRDFPEGAFAMATLASIGASEQKAAKHGDTTRTHRR